MPAISPDDLTTVQQVANATIIEGGNSELIQALITALSRYVKQFCGRTNLNRVATVTDMLDGSGSDKQFVTEWPIKSITSVSIWNVGLNPSPDGVAPGYVADTNAVILLPNTSVGAPLSHWNYVVGKFPRGRRNVKIVYEAGYDLTTTPPSDPAYNNAPSDLGYAVTQLVVQQYRRKDWVDQAGKTLAAGETLSFHTWQWPPLVESIIQEYKQPWPIS